MCVQAWTPACVSVWGGGGVEVQWICARVYVQSYEFNFLYFIFCTRVLDVACCSFSCTGCAWNSVLPFLFALLRVCGEVSAHERRRAHHGPPRRSRAVRPVPAFLRGAFEGDHTVRIVVVFSDTALKVDAARAAPFGLGIARGPPEWESGTTPNIFRANQGCPEPIRADQGRLCGLSADCVCLADVCSQCFAEAQNGGSTNSEEAAHEKHISPTWIIHLFKGSYSLSDPLANSSQQWNTPEDRGMHFFKNRGGGLLG